MNEVIHRNSDGGKEYCRAIRRRYRLCSSQRQIGDYVETRLRNILVATMVGMAAVLSYGQVPTIYEPSANDPRIQAVLEAQKRAEDAAKRADWKTVEDSF